MLRRSRIARWMIVPGALTLVAGMAVPAADAGTIPKRKLQANNFRFCSIHKDACVPDDEGKVSRVAKGTRVIWIYKDTVCDGIPACPGHNVKIGTNPRSDTVKTEGATIARKIFNNVGTYRYHCTIHGDQGMTGKIVVVKP